MLKTIKLVHTVIWVVMASAAFYILYSGITKTFNTLLYVSIGLILLEAITLMINKWDCPLTPMARKYSEDTKDNFDIYLPNWLAKHNKTIFTAIFIIGIVLVIINWIRN